MSTGVLYICMRYGGASSLTERHGNTCCHFMTYSAIIMRDITVLQIHCRLHTCLLRVIEGSLLSVGIPKLLFQVQI
jgi:hypothetical protein